MGSNLEFQLSVPSFKAVLESKIFEETMMSRNNKKSVGLGIILMLFGVFAMGAGLKLLIVPVPAAMLIWYGAYPQLRSGRN